MRRMIFILLFVVFCCSALCFAESLEFSLVFNKSGVTQFYFCEPSNNEIRMNSLSFSLISNASQSASAEIGVVWKLFPDGVYSDATENLRLILEAASANPTPSNDNSQDYMLHENSDNSIGVNYNINIESYVIKENTYKPQDLEIDINERGTPIPGEERRIILFEGTVGNNGASGSATLNLELNPPKTVTTQPDGTVTEGYAFMNGEYTGYLILHVQSYS